jgi:hypothetical protein
MTDKKYIEVLKLSCKVWIWLYKNPGKEKNDSPYWDDIKDLKHYYFLKNQLYLCDFCILYKKRACRNSGGVKRAYYLWAASCNCITLYYQAKISAARIASIIRREYEKLTGNKKTFRSAA